MCLRRALLVPISGKEADARGNANRHNMEARHDAGAGRRGRGGQRNGHGRQDAVLTSLRPAEDATRSRSIEARLGKDRGCKGRPGSQATGFGSRRCRAGLVSVEGMALGVVGGVDVEEETWQQGLGVGGLARSQRRAVGGRGSGSMEQGCRTCS